MLGLIGFRSGACGLACLVLSGVAGCSTAQSGVVQVKGEESGYVGALAVDVQNRLGEVDVQVDPSLRAPSVEALPMDSTFPVGRVDRDSSFRPWVAAELSAGEGGRVLRVLCEPQEGQPVRPVYLLVRVPACEGVRVRNTGGAVRLKDVGGAIDVDNAASRPPMWSDGAAVVVNTGRVLTSGVSLTSADGEVSLTLPRSSTGVIEASSPDTVVNLAAVAGSQRNTSAKTTLKGVWTGVLNGGENVISLKSGNRVRMATTVEPVPYPPVKKQAAAESATATDGAK